MQDVFVNSEQVNMFEAPATGLLMYPSINCAGTSEATAAVLSPFVNPYRCRIAVANWVDDNNYGVAISVGSLASPTTILANGPDGKTIVIFLIGAELVDGSTSVELPCGLGKTFFTVVPGGIDPAVVVTIG